MKKPIKRKEFDRDRLTDKLADFIIDSYFNEHVNNKTSPDDSKIISYPSNDG